MAQNTKSKSRTTVHTPITEVFIGIIGRTVQYLEKKYHIKFRAVNWKKAEPQHRLCLDDQIEIYGPNKNVFGFLRDAT